MDQIRSSFKRKTDEKVKLFAKKRKTSEQHVNDFMANVLAKSKSRFSENHEFSAAQVNLASTRELFAESDFDLSDQEDFVEVGSETEDNEDNDLRTFEDDDGKDVTCINPFDEVDDKDYRRVQMNESERIMIMLLLQGRFDTPNNCTEISCKVINDFGAKMFSTTDWDTLTKRVPNSFCPDISKYFYSNCGELIGPVLDMSKSATCKYGHSSCRITPNQKTSETDCSKYFCYVSLGDSLLHQIPVIHDKLLINRRGRKTKYFHDLHCSDKYQSLTATKDDSVTILTITLTWDGVAYNKNQKSMWPLVAFLNELPFTDRINNPMLIALHSGETKPESDIMLRPLVDELLKFEVEPLSVMIGEKMHFFKVRLYLVIADAPARAMILNCNQHNSYYGKFKHLFYFYLFNYFYC